MSQRQPGPRSTARLILPVAVLFGWVTLGVLGLGLAAADAVATTTINHQFSPATLNPGDVSKYRITLTNDDTGSALANMKVTVALAAQIRIASLASIANTCGFTVNQPVAAGGSTVELVGGTLAAGIAGVPSQCYFEIDVLSTSPGNWINTIPGNPIAGPNPPGTPTIAPDATTTGYVATTQATGVLVANATPADATLSVNTLSAPTGSKSFSPSPAYAGNPVTLTIVLSNPNAAATMPLTSFTDTLPDDGGGHAMRVNGTPTVACTGAGKVDGSVAKAADDTSVTLTGATIGNGGSCTIGVPVVVSSIAGTAQAFDNVVASGAIGNVRGLTSPAFNRALTVNTPIAIAKSFATSPIPAGQPSLLTLTISNRSSVSSLDIGAFADDLTGTTLQVLTTASTPVAAPANPVVACTAGTGSSAGTLSYVADTLDTTISLANAVAVANGNCTITAYVTSYVDGAHGNTTGKVTNPVHGWDSTPASASITAVAQLRVSKTVSVASVAPGQWTEFTVTISNYTGGIVNNVLFRDLLPANGGRQMVVFDPAAAGIYSTSAGCIGGSFTGLDAGGVSTSSLPVSGVDAGLQWSGGSIVAGTGVSPGICTIRLRAQLPATATTGMGFTNSIGQGAITGELPGGGAVTNPDTIGSAGVTTVDSIAVTKGFAPSSIAQGGTSTLSIVVYNRTVNSVSGIDLTDNLPSGVVLAANPAPTSNCGGALQAFPGGTQVKLTGGSLAPRPDASQQTTCTITVKVTAGAVGSYANTIAPVNFASSAGTIAGNATAGLAVTTGITGSKAFVPTAVTPGGTARATITINNTSSGQLSNVSIDDDTMGAGLAIANPANAATSCAGSPTQVVNPGATRAQLQGATLNAGASCTFSFDVRTSGSGPWSNTIPAGNVRSAEGPSNTAAIGASLAVNTASIGINKSFLTPIVTGGVPSVLQIDVVNGSAIAIHNASFTDTFPVGVQVYSVPAASTTCAGGTVSAVPGDGKVVLTGATLAPNATCQVLVTTTSVKFLNLTNTIPALSMTSAEGYTNPLATSASLSTLQGLGVAKGFAPAYIAAGQTTRLKVTVVSTFDPNAVTPTNLTGVSFTDTLPTGVTVVSLPASPTTCSDGSGGFAAVTAAPGGTALTLSGATIPAGTNCSVEVDVTASVVGAYDNTIPKDGVTSTQGITNQTPATARLSVVTQPTISKSFSASPVQMGQVSRLTVTISNGSGTALSGIGLIDRLPPGLALAATPSASTTCSNGVVAASAGDDVLSLAGATLASGASCSFAANVVSNAAGSYANDIGVGKLVTDQGLTNPGPASATLVVVPPAAVTKRFSPASILADGSDHSTLTITLANTSADPITLTADLVDALPGNIVVAPTPNLGGSCSGTKAAAAGGTTVTLQSGAAIPAGSCTLAVDVVSTVAGSYVNVIAAGQMQTSAGNNQDPAIATLGVGQPASPTIDKAFSPTTIFTGDTTTLTITLGNANLTALTLVAPLVDTLPANLSIQGTPVTDCSGGSFSWTAGTLTLGVGNQIPGPAGCTITATVTSVEAGAYTNSIAAADLVTDAGSPPLSAEAPLVVKSLVPPAVRKTLDPSTINPGGLSTLTIHLDNDNVGSITLNSTLTDTLPAAVAVAAVPAIGGSCTFASIAATPGGSTISYAAAAAIPAGGCTITVAVTSAAPGGPYVNTIAAGALDTSAGSNGAPGVASLFVNPFQPPSVSKSFAPATLPKNGTSTLAISLGNGNAAAITLTSDFVDTLPPGLVVATPNGLVASAGCDAPKVLAPAAGNTVTYQAGATLAGGGGCSIQVNVTAATAATYTNTIAAGDLVTGAGSNALAAAAAVQFVEWPTAPDLALTKAVAPNTGQVARDAQTVTLSWRNGNAATPTRNLYQCAVVDTLPSAAYDLAVDAPTPVSTPAGYVFSYDAGTGTVTYARADTTTPCETTLQTATFTVRLMAGVVTGSSYTNRADASAKTLPSNDPNAAAAVTLTRNANATVAVVAPPTPTKSVVATSQGFTDPGDASVNANPPVAIGETVTYSIPFALPPGVTRGVTLGDEIRTPAAIGDVALLSATLARSSVNLTAVADPGGINAAAAATPVDVTGSTVTTGSEFRVTLGNVTNADAANQTYTLVVTLRVANVAGNTLGHAINDRGVLGYLDVNGAAGSVPTGERTVHVGLPGIAVTKGVSTAAPAAGDVVTYTLTLTNTAGANAVAGFDVTFTDTLPGDLINPTGPNFNVGTTGAVAAGGFTGNVLSGTVDRLDPGESVTVSYTAQVKTDTPFGKTIVNGASAQITTLSGADANERTISSTAASQTLTTSTPSIAKTLLNGQARYAIGDIVSYRVTVSLPVGTTTSLTVTDALPSGLTFVAGSATLALSAGVSGPVAGAIAPSPASPVTFALGPVTVIAAGTLTIDYQAQVLNVGGNQNNTALVNSAAATYDRAGVAGTITAASPPSITVGEPNLTLTKAIVSGATGAQAGSVVRWRYTVANSGPLPAYQSIVGDTLPPGLAGISVVSVTASGGNVQQNNAGCAAGAAVGVGDAAVSTTVNAGDTLTLAGLCFAPGATLTVDFDATAMNTVTPAAPLTNSVRASYASQPSGTSATAVVRDGADSGTDDDTDPVGSCNGTTIKCNNYNESASNTLTIDASIAIDKQASTTTATIGELLTYSIKVSLIQGSTPAVVVEDVLPAGLSYVSHAITFGHLGIAPANAAYATRLGTGQTVRFDFGNVQNDANGNGADDWLNVDLAVRVDNVAGNQGGGVLRNGQGGTVTVKYGAGPTTVTYDFDGLTAGIQGRPLTLTEPLLAATKAVVPASQALGDSVTYTITLTHAAGSTADAYDVTLTDTLAAGLEFVPGSVTPSSSYVGVAGQVLSLRVDPLDPLTLAKHSTTITYQARIAASAAVGTPLGNTVAGTYTSQLGATGASTSGRTGSGGVNDYTFGASTAVTPNQSAAIYPTKTVAQVTDDGDGVLEPGERIEYTVRLTNTTGAALADVAFADTLPPQTTYVPGSLASTHGSVDAAAAPTLAVSIPALAASAAATITFRAQVNAGVPVGTVIANQGVVDSSTTVPTPTDADGVPGNGAQPTLITVGGTPTPQQALYAEKLVALVTDADASGSVTLGDRMRYSIVLHNLGGGTLTNVAFGDTIPAGLAYVPGSAAAGAGTLGVSGGTVTWSAIGALAPGASVAATFDVTIASVSGSTQTYVNQGAATSTETGGVFTDDNGDPGDGNQPTQFTAVSGGGTAAPLIDVQKRWAVAVDTAPLGVPSPGDTLQYTVTVSNQGSAAATNVRLTDAVPACTGALDPCTSYVSGSLAASQGAIVTEQPIDVNLGTLPAGGVATLGFRVVVSPSTADGTVIANQASVTRTGGSGPVLSDDNGNAGDGINPTLTPIAATAGGSGVPGALAKVLAGSSETASSGTTALVGEVLRYQVTVAMPKGTTRQVAIADVLPAGLGYLPGSARLARTFTTGLAAAANPGGINSAPAGTFVALADGSGIVVGSGAGGTTTLDVFLGDVIDSDADASTPESYTLDYRAVVANIAGNQAGTALANAATVHFWNTLGQPQALTPASSAVTVAEPVVTLTKAAAPGALLTTGGSTQFTLTVANVAGANAAPAFDLTISDPLPAAYTGVGARVITATGATGVADTTSGTAVGATIARLDPGGSVTIVFSAVASGPLTAGPVVNNANLSWTSLPGANGSAADGAATPGSAGSATGERTGTGGTNDYAASATATVTVGGVAIAKSVVAPQARYAIGDTVGYRVDIAVPGSAFGSLPDVVLTDVLGAGLSYVPGTLAVTYNGVTAATPPADFAHADNTPTAGAQTLTASFGALTNAAGTTATVTLTYQARVDNLLVNQANVALDNAATLAFTDAASGGATATRGPVTTSVTVGEPMLALSKALTSPAAGLVAGSTASFSVTVGNSGTTTAFETVLADSLPTGLFLPAGALVTVVPTNLSGNLQVPSVTVGSDGWQTSAFDLPPGDSVTFTFTATLAGTVQPGQVLQNGVTATYSSRDGVDPGERNGSTVGSVQTDDTLLDNYNAAATATSLTVADPIAIAKAFHPDGAQTRYAVGQLVTYRLALSVLEGTTRSVRITDTLPAGLSFVSAGSPGTPPGAPISFAYGGAPTVVGQVVSFDLGDVVDVANGNAADDVITIDLVARVDNVVGNQDATVLGNHLGVSFVDAGSVTRTRQFDSDAATPGVQPLELTVVEPVLALTKAVDVASQSLGDLVTFTLVIGHPAASHADAYDVTLVDTLPAGLAFEPGSVNPPGALVAVAGQALTLGVGTLTQVTGSRTISYQATVRFDATPGSTQTNAVQATWASTPGATGAAGSGRNGNGGVNDYTVGAQATVTPNANAQIVADKTVALVVDTDGSGNLTGGDVVEWTVVLTNTGAAVTAAVFTDEVPANVTLVAGSLVTTKGTPTEALPTLRVDVGPLASGEVVTIRFRTRVNVGLPMGTVLSNQGTVDSGQTVPTPTDGDGNPANGRQPTTIVVMGAPDLVVAKSHGGNFSQGQTGATWTLVVTNAGTAPTIAPVTVDDTLPAGVTATAIGGTGWSCTLVPLSCTRSDALPVGASWPPISLVVSLDPLIPAGTIVNTATVSGGGESVTTNNIATDSVTVDTTILQPPIVAKTATLLRSGVIEWRLVVINAANALPLTIQLADPTPIGVTYVDGSLACQPAGSTVVVGCSFDPVTRRVVVDARLGPDAGHADAATAANELVVVLHTVIQSGVGAVANVASVKWDANSTGTVGDDTLQVAAVARAGFEIAIPGPAAPALLVLSLLLAAAGWHRLRRGAGERLR